MKIGIVLGNGWSESFRENKLSNLKYIETTWLMTIYGEPTSEICTWESHSHKILYLFRHGNDNLIPAQRVPYIANASALYRMGVDIVIGLGTAGSLSNKLSVGGLAIVSKVSTRYCINQAEYENIDYSSYMFGNMKNCFEINISKSKSGFNIYNEANYVQISGPDPAPTNDVAYYENQGFDVIGMTLGTEWAAMNSLSIPYRPICFVTDSCGRTDEQPAWDKLVIHGVDIVEKIINSIVKNE